MKKLLSAIGLLAVATPTALTVVACGSKALSEEQKAEKVVAAINKATYERSILVSSEEDAVKNLKAKINNDVIKFQLDESLKKSYENDFILKEITNDTTKKPLENSELSSVGTIEATITYDYKSFKDQVTKLTINVKDKMIDKEYFLNEEVVYMIGGTNNKLYSLTWVGDEESEEQTAGLYEIDVKNDTHKKVKEFKNRIFANFIQGMDGNFYFWEGSENSGKIYLVKLDSKTFKESRVLEFDGNNTFVSFLVVGSNGNLYTLESNYDDYNATKVCEINLKNKKMSVKYEIEDSSTSIENLIASSNGDNLYLTLDNGDINKIDIKADTMKKIYSSEVEDDYIQKLVEISEDRLVFIEDNKINLFDLVKEEVIKVLDFGDISQVNFLDKLDDDKLFLGMGEGKFFEIDLINDENKSYDSEIDEGYYPYWKIVNNTIYMGVKESIYKVIT